MTETQQAKIAEAILSGWKVVIVPGHYTIRGRGMGVAKRHVEYRVSNWLWGNYLSKLGDYDLVVNEHGECLRDRYGRRFL